MVIRSTFSRHRRALSAGAALLAVPALAVALGSTDHEKTSNTAAHAPAQSPSGSAVAGAAGPGSQQQRSVPSSPASPSTPSDPTGSVGASSALTPSPADASESNAARSADRPTVPAPSSATPSPATPSPDASASPGSRPAPQRPAPGSLIGHTASGGRTVALTFDDGPGPATGPVLDLLAQYGAKATFCQVGKEVDRDPAAVQRILAEGHQLCDHTADHPQPMHRQSHDQQVTEIGAAKDSIRKAGGAGAKVTWWRAPGGDFTAENVRIAKEQGMKSLTWTVDPRDWSKPGTQAIVSTVQQDLKPGGVVLFHDGGGDRTQTVEALKQLLPWLVAQGYTFDFPAS
ncbi:polysaccharide deacetylase family protein [Kitasatospora camelliae]|uniref:Polysaccharide deacetylase family protein n=1 Tax=Kitasatospora camelliae TaxID=3156397 RepID=A0AAU8JTI5_9ACTN